MAVASVNKVILLGNLGADPELKYTPSGKAVASFTLATSSFAGKDREPLTEWHKIVVWDKLAEQCSQYLSKGRQAYVEGRLQTRSWDDKQTGQKRYTTEIVAIHVLFLGSSSAQSSQSSSYQGRSSKPESNDGSWNQRGSSNQSKSNQYSDGLPEYDDIPAGDFPDDDIPF